MAQILSEVGEQSRILLEKALDALPMSHARVAKELGVSKAALSRYLNGTRETPKAVVLRVMFLVYEAMAQLKFVNEQLHVALETPELYFRRDPVDGRIRIAEAWLKAEAKIKQNRAKGKKRLWSRTHPRRDEREMLEALLSTRTPVREE
jgi:transcriptional regulator with XRE-family HTH domain